MPGLADWCAVDLLNERGEIDRVALAHPDPEKVQLGKRLQERYPPDLDPAAGLGAVRSSGVAELYPEITDAMLEAGAIDDEHLAMIRALGCARRSWRRCARPSARSA